jgi:malate/lactate dehydrogenase
MIYFLLAEYADLSTCTTFVSGVNVQASNQLASCEGARIVILCDVNDSEDQETQSDTTLSNFKTTSRAISLFGA